MYLEAVAPSSVDCKHATNEDIASASLWSEGLLWTPLAFPALSPKGWARSAGQAGKHGVAVVGGGWRAGCWRLPQVWERKLSTGVVMPCGALKASDLAGGFSVWPGCKNSLSCDCVCSAPQTEQTAPHTCTLLTHSYLFAGANDCLCTQTWGEGPPPSFSLLAHVPLEQVVGPQNWQNVRP